MNRVRSPHTLLNDQLKQDGAIFPDEYLQQPNPEVVENIKWPVPVLKQETLASTQNGSGNISPGDVLELVDGSREQYLLVLSISNNTSNRGGSLIVCYATNTEQIEVLFESGVDTISSEQETTLPQNKLQNDRTYVDTGAGVFAIHRDVVNPVDDDPVASRSYMSVDPITRGGVDAYSIRGWYPHNSPPTPESVNYPAIVETDTDETGSKPVSEFTNQFIVGEAGETLQQLPENSVHTLVTSPPYPGAQRTYDSTEGEKAEFGHEDTAGEYLSTLIPIIIQAMDVVRDDGTGWIILDDWIDDGAFAGVPDRLVGLLQQHGEFNVIHNGPWTKNGGNSGLPDPAENRFGHAHERVIGISNQSDYYFDRQAIPDTESDNDVFNHGTSANSEHEPPETGPTHDAKFPVELVDNIIRAATPEGICPECGKPAENVYEVTDILDVDCPHTELVKKSFEKTNITRKHARACASKGVAASGNQGKRTQDGAGNNTDEVEKLVKEVEESEFPNSYMQCFSTAIKEQVGTELSCSCSGATKKESLKGGIIIDPFCGVGSTCVAASGQQKQYIGIDLNEEYIEKARKWLDKGAQASLTNW